jgi:hypothetical protein
MFKDGIYHNQPERRGFLRRLAGFTGVSALAATDALAQQGSSAAAGSSRLAEVPPYARSMNHRSLKQSSFDRTGGNRDAWQIAPGGMQTVFESEGPGIISHIWFTIDAESSNHLKEIVLRGYWDGHPKPSIEVPVGDFFGLNLGQYFLYQSAFMNCSPVKAMNCYFAMPFQKSARFTVTNEGKRNVGNFYSNVDYKLVSELPPDSMYFHAQYRQDTPEVAVKFDAGQKELNLLGEKNYVFAEAQGRGHLMGVTFGVVQNTENWMGEGDEMIFVDDASKPLITGTGTEDYINGAWDFGGRDSQVPFGYLYNGAPYIALGERTGGRTVMYRWHADNPVTFTTYLKHTIEHGHANDRGDNIYSVCYWYQTVPYTNFPALPVVRDRLAHLNMPPA